MKLLYNFYDLVNILIISNCLFSAEYKENDLKLAEFIKKKNIGYLYIHSKKEKLKVI